MAKGRRRTRKPAPQAGAEPKQHGRHAAIWLATLSTVVGIATGMFTLRDQVFPRESGSAQAVSTVAYQQQVGRVCDELNSDDSRRARQLKTIRKQLRQAETTTAQRNALLDGQRKTIARSGHALASLTSLETPKPLRATDRATEAAWTRNLTRLQTYAERLDRVETRAQLVSAVAYLSSLRTPLAQDGVKLMSGLRRLGGANCDLRTPISTPTFPLPPLHRSEPVQEVASTGAGSGSGEVAGATAQSGATGSGATEGSGTAGISGGGAGTGTPGTIGGAPPGGTGTAGTTGGGVSAGSPGTLGGGGAPLEGGGGGGGGGGG